MKKTKFMTKVMAVVFALAILFAMSVPAFADSTITTNNSNTYSGASTTNNPTPAAITGSNIPLTKSIVFINSESKAVYEPNITYTYTITSQPVAAGTTVDDGTNPAVKVLDGLLTTNNGNIFNNSANPTVAIQFGTTVGGTTTAAVPATSNGYELERTANITINAANFEHAGIYRYKITETTNPPDITTVGLTARTTSGQNAYDPVRYLDVYIKNGQNGLEMYGAVMFKTTGTSANSDEGKDAITTTTLKTTGFEPATEPTSGTTVNYTDDTTVDRYTTYNVKVKKTVDGGLGDKKNQFPFTFTINDTIPEAKYSYEVTNSNSTAAAVAVTVAQGASTSTINGNYGNDIKLANDDYFIIYGVPSNQSTPVNVTVGEKNNTPDTYKVTIDENGNSLIAANTSIGNNATAVTNAPTNINSTMKTIAFTNTLDEISPTGLAFRVAPYVLMLLAGVSLVLLFAKRRREITDMI